MSCNTLKQDLLEIETIANFKNLQFPSMIDTCMSCVLCFGNIMHD